MERMEEVKGTEVPPGPGEPLDEADVPVDSAESNPEPGGSSEGAELPASSNDPPDPETTEQPNEHSVGQPAAATPPGEITKEESVVNAVIIDLSDTSLSRSNRAGSYNLQGDEVARDDAEPNGSKELPDEMVSRKASAAGSKEGLGISAVGKDGKKPEDATSTVKSSQPGLNPDKSASESSRSRAESRNTSRKESKVVDATIASKRESVNVEHVKNAAKSEDVNERLSLAREYLEASTVKISKSRPSSKDLPPASPSLHLENTEHEKETSKTVSAKGYDPPPMRVSHRQSSLAKNKTKDVEFDHDGGVTGGDDNDKDDDGDNDDDNKGDHDASDDYEDSGDVGHDNDSVVSNDNEDVVGNDNEGVVSNVKEGVVGNDNDGVVGNDNAIEIPSLTASAVESPTKLSTTSFGSIRSTRTASAVETPTRFGSKKSTREASVIESPSLSSVPATSELASLTASAVESPTRSSTTSFGSSQPTRTASAVETPTRCCSTQVGSKKSTREASASASPISVSSVPATSELSSLTASAAESPTRSSTTSFGSTQPTRKTSVVESPKRCSSTQIGSKKSTRRASSDGQAGCKHSNLKTSTVESLKSATLPLASSLNEHYNEEAGRSESSDVVYEEESRMLTPITEHDEKARSVDNRSKAIEGPGFKRSCVKSGNPEACDGSYEERPPVDPYSGIIQYPTNTEGSNVSRPTYSRTSSFTSRESQRQVFPDPDVHSLTPECLEETSHLSFQVFRLLLRIYGFLILIIDIRNKLVVP